MKSGECSESRGFKQNLIEFTQASSLHGLRYIYAEEVHILRK